ncbi:Pimeloyl-ACP methyl ester carboxylesterase [Blastococcus aggregatus]|uniref:Pimeloyl-ACP methyl ester carboxylesterase n=1 Tax=Blastococcus aggregatus TaxID=38502 RepID=A0A285VAH8_9ACTN|nr:alpha/beta hydrolase [Blastococcus aggregatus]SOC50056.1 Pimeloyl-ACP methyl ester carboxylesterase [Blastococcus aggregatus]
MSRRTVWSVPVAVTSMVALRHLWTRRLAARTTGTPPSVRTDDGVRLHTEVAGPADAGTTVVFTHGFAARASVFDHQWAALRASVRLVRYDQRGHGASGWAGLRSSTVERLGRDLGQVVDALGGAGRVVVVGHSMGGMAVLALARLRPELFGRRIAGAALLSTRATPLAAHLDSSGAALRVRLALAAAGAWLVWFAAPLVQALHPFRSRIGRGLLRRRLFAGEPGDALGRAQDMWVQTPVVVLSAYARSLAHYDARAAVSALRTVPVLVLAGSDDATIPARSAGWLADHIGGRTRLVLVPGAGHMVNVTHAAAVDAALHDLLADVRADPDGRTTT